MPRFSVKQPNGLHAIFSTVVDDFIYVNLTVKNADVTLRRYGVGEFFRNRISFEECIDTICSIHGEDIAKERLKICNIRKD